MEAAAKEKGMIFPSLLQAALHIPTTAPLAAIMIPPSGICPQPRRHDWFDSFVRKVVGINQSCMRMPTAAEFASLIHSLKNDEWRIPPGIAICAVVEDHVIRPGFHEIEADSPTNLIQFMREQPQGKISFPTYVEMRSDKVLDISRMVFIVQDIKE